MTVTFNRLQVTSNMAERKRKERSRGDLTSFFNKDVTDKLYGSDQQLRGDKKPPNGGSQPIVIRFRGGTLEHDHQQVLNVCKADYHNAWFLNDDRSIKNFFHHRLDDRLNAFQVSSKKDLARKHALRQQQHQHQEKEEEEEMEIHQSSSEKGKKYTDFFALADDVVNTFDQRNKNKQKGATTHLNSTNVIEEFHTMFLEDIPAVMTKDGSNRQSSTSLYSSDRYKQQFVVPQMRGKRSSNSKSNSLQQKPPDVAMFTNYLKFNILSDRASSSYDDDDDDDVANQHYDATEEEIQQIVTIHSDQIIAFDLSNYLLGDSRGAYLSSCLNYCRRILRINLSNNSLTDRSLQLIVRAVFAYTQCESLDISHNKCSKGTVQHLMEHLNSSSGSFLRLLYINNCGLRDIDFYYLSQCLHHNQTLQLLNIAGNDFLPTYNHLTNRPSYNNNDDDRWGVHIDEDLCYIEDAPSYRFEDYYGNNRAYGINCFGLSLNHLVERNSYLLELNLSDNHISSSYITMLSKCLMVNQTLQSLHLSGIELTDKDACHIGCSLHSHPSLTKVDLSNNKIQSRAALTIAYAAQQADSAIVLLDLTGNNNICYIGNMYLFRAMRHVALINYSTGKAVGEGKGIGSKTTSSTAVTATVAAAVTGDRRSDHTTAHGTKAHVSIKPHRQLVINYDLRSSDDDSSNTSGKSSTAAAAINVYDLRHDIHGTYVLDMSDPYDYTVMRRLQDVADKHPYITIKPIKHYETRLKKDEHNNNKFQFIYLNRKSSSLSSSSSSSSGGGGDTFDQAMGGSSAQQQCYGSSIYQLPLMNIWSNNISKVILVINTMNFVLTAQQRIDKQHVNVTRRRSTMMKTRSFESIFSIKLPKNIIQTTVSMNTSIANITIGLEDMKSKSYELMGVVLKQMGMVFETSIIERIISRLMSMHLPMDHHDIEFRYLLIVVYTAIIEYMVDNNQLDMTKDERNRVDGFADDLQYEDTMSISWEALESHLSIFGSFNHSEDFHQYFSSMETIKRIISEGDVTASREGLTFYSYIRFMLYRQCNILPHSSHDCWSTSLVTKGSRDAVRSRWVIPKEGVLHVDIECSLCPEIHSDCVLSNKGLLSLIYHFDEHSNNDHQPNMIVYRQILIILQGRKNELYLTCEQSEVVLLYLLSHTNSTNGTQQQQQQQQQQQVVMVTNHRNVKVGLIEKLLYQITTVMEVQRFLVRNLSFNGLVKMRKRLGYMFKVLTGNVTGHYFLKLKNPLHRDVALRLAQQSAYEKNNELSVLSNINHIININDKQEILSNQGIKLNASQNNNGECFRNASFDSKYVQLDETWFQSGIPDTGILRFDFVSYLKVPTFFENSHYSNDRNATYHYSNSMFLEGDNKKSKSKQVQRQLSVNSLVSMDTAITTTTSNLIDVLLEPKFNCASLVQLLNTQIVVLPVKRKQDFVRKFRKSISGTQVSKQLQESGSNDDGDDDRDDDDGGGVHTDVGDITIEGDKEASDGPAATKQELRESTGNTTATTTATAKTSTKSTTSNSNISTSNIDIPSPEEEVVSFWKDVLASNGRTIRMNHVDMLRKRLYDLNKEEIKRLQEEAQRLQIYFGSSTGLPTGYEASNV